MSNKLTMLMILDGFGINEKTEGNAVKLANIPNLNEILSKNPNTIFLLSNNSKYYKSILGGLNHRDIITLFITDNKDDLYLEYSNIIAQYSENIKEVVKSLKPKTLSFDIEGDVL